MSLDLATPSRLSQLGELLVVLSDATIPLLERYRAYAKTGWLLRRFSHFKTGENDPPADSAASPWICRWTRSFGLGSRVANRQCRFGASSALRIAFPRTGGRTCLQMRSALTASKLRSFRPNTALTK